MSLHRGDVEVGMSRVSGLNSPSTPPCSATSLLTPAAHSVIVPNSAVLHQQGMGVALIACLQVFSPQNVNRYGFVYYCMSNV